MFDDLYYVDLVVVYFALCYPRLIVLLWFFLPVLISIFSVLVKRLAGMSFSDMTYLALSGMLILNSISQRIEWKQVDRWPDNSTFVDSVVHKNILF